MASSYPPRRDRGQTIATWLGIVITGAVVVQRFVVLEEAKQKAIDNHVLQMDPNSGAISVRRLKHRLAVGNGPEFYVFGNTADYHRLDRERGVLGEQQEADGVPDFASRTANGELLVVRAAGTVADLWDRAAGSDSPQGV